jgi:hypothetical protein
MGGLAKLCKLHGSMRVNDRLMVWDYVLDKAVPSDEMPEGSARWQASERAKWLTLATYRKD